MIIDAMDILYSGNVDGFCIVSSDSDFTKLSSRLRESGMLVVGMGEKKTPKPFIASCNQFKYLDVLAETEEKNKEINNQTSSGSLSNQNRTDSREEAEQDSQDKSGKWDKSNLKTMTELNTIKAAIIKMMNEIDDDEQSMHMGELGSKLVKRYPDFDVRNYGDTKLSKFLKKFDFLDINTKIEEGGTSMWVSMKQNDIPQKNTKNTSNQTRRKRYYKKK